MWGEYEEKGLVILALSDEGKSTVERFVEDFGMTYPTASGAKSSRAYGVSGIPAAFLLGWDGRVLWQGNPLAAGWEGMLDEALEEARKMADQWDPGEQPSYLKKAVSHALKGDIGKAWKEASAVASKMSEDLEAVAKITTFQSLIEERAGYRSAYAETMLQEGRVFEACEFLASSGKVFKGAPAEAAWNEQIKLLKKDQKELYSLDKKRVDALEEAAKGSPDKALKSLEKLKEKASGTPLYPIIQEDMGRVAAQAAR